MLCERPSFPFPLNPTPAGTSLIVVASSAGHAAVVEYLADRGADLTARNATFLWNALFAAAAGGHADVVEVLLARGIDTSALDFEVRRRETTTGCEHGNTATAVVQFNGTGIGAPRRGERPNDRAAFSAVNTTAEAARAVGAGWALRPL